MPIYRQELTLLAQKRKLQCEASLYEFCKDAFEIIHAGKKLVPNWHIKLICDRLQEEAERMRDGRPRTRHLIFNIPPRSLKSEMITVFFSAWIWIHAPSVKFISSSYSAGLSIDHNVMARRVVESEWFRKNWGAGFALTTDVNTKSRYENDHDGSRECTSTGGTVTGKGGDIIVIDDPVNPKQAMSEKERREANDFFDLTLSTRLNDPDHGLFIIVMQRLHEEDLCGHVLKKEPGKWERISIPAEAAGDVQPEALRKHYIDSLFFPARFSASHLSFLRIAMGSFGYSGQVLQSPTSENAGLIKRSYFRYYRLSDVIHVGAANANGTGNSAENGQRVPVWNFTFDGAYTKNELNDPSSIFCWAGLDNDMYIREVASVWEELPELIKFIKDFVRRNGYTSQSRIWMEPAASGMSAAQVLKRTTNLNVIIDEMPQRDKVARVKSTLPFLESGRCLLPENAAWVEGFVHQCVAFPHSAHDDEVDCLTMAVGKMTKVVKKHYVI